MLSNFASLTTPFVGIIAIVALAILVFEIAMIISAIQNRSLSSEARLLWVIGMLLIHPFIAILYYFTDYRKGR